MNFLGCIFKQGYIIDSKSNKQLNLFQTELKAEWIGRFYYIEYDKIEYCLIENMFHCCLFCLLKIVKWSWAMMGINRNSLFMKFLNKIVTLILQHFGKWIFMWVLPFSDIFSFTKKPHTILLLYFKP